MEDDDDVTDIGSLMKDASPPLIWTRKLTARLLAEFKTLGPKVGESIRSMAILYSMISKILSKEFKCQISPSQVCNKMKSIKRKYLLLKEKGRPVNDIGPGVDEVLKLLDRLVSRKWPRIYSSIDQSGNVVQSFKPQNEQSYSVEIVDDDETNMMDLQQFLSKKAEPREAVRIVDQDPLVGDEVTLDMSSRACDMDKLNLLEKKVEAQQKNIEEKHRKNELIEERNRLIATLLTRKSKNEAVESIRKDRIIHHLEMKNLWAERLEIENKKLMEKKRKNDLLEEKNQLMKVLIAKMTEKNSKVLCNKENDSEEQRAESPSEDNPILTQD